MLMLCVCAGLGKFQHTLRSLWDKATVLAKGALDLKGAVATAEKLASSLQDIEASLPALGFPLQTKWTCIMEACEIIEMLSKEPAENLSEEFSSALSSLVDAKESLFRACPKLESSVVTLIDFLKTQWPEGCESSVLTLGSRSDMETLKKEVFSPSAMAGARFGTHVKGQEVFDLNIIFISDSYHYPFKSIYLCAINPPLVLIVVAASYCQVTVIVRVIVI